jgi:ABC transporter substrate binding protein (PQQ-dependent alcohol dehydrogenase system)
MPATSAGMTRLGRAVGKMGSLWFALGMLGLTFCIPATAQQPQPPLQRVTIGYVEIQGDPRYEPIQEYTRLVLKQREHPYAGAEIGIEDARPLQRALKSEFALARISVKSAEEAAPALLAAAKEQDIHFFLLDLPEPAMKPIADAVRGRDLMLFNISASDDSLRRKLCAPEFVHVIPSLAMQMDALLQYLVSKKWRDILVFEGPHPEDAAAAQAFTHSAQKFGARIVADQHFKPGTDPREREQNDPALLSAVNRDYDVVFVADSEFDFARSVPYRTIRPRPVVGSIDLMPVAWHWTWDHNGAPQVNGRFAQRAGGRHMEGGDWAAWMAVKLVVQAALHSRSSEFAKLRTFILGEGSFDGDKGLALSVRPWDHQLRQAVLLAADYSVVASAPIEGFLHQKNVLDTLGDDQPESPCHLDR